MLSPYIIIDNKLFYSPELKLVISCGTGIDNIGLIFTNKYGVIVNHPSEILVPPVIELDVGLMISTTRRIIEASKYCNEGKSKSYDPGMFCWKSIKDSNVLIVDYGKVGTGITEVIWLLDANISYVSQTEDIKMKNMSCCKVSLLGRLAWTDIIVLCCELNQETKTYVNGKVTENEEISIIINVARWNC